MKNEGFWLLIAMMIMVTVLMVADKAFN